MPIVIRDAYIERLIAEEQRERANKTAARTARDLIHERLQELQNQRRASQLPSLRRDED